MGADAAGGRVEEEDQQQHHRHHQPEDVHQPDDPPGKLGGGRAWNSGRPAGNGFWWHSRQFLASRALHQYGTVTACASSVFARLPDCSISAMLHLCKRPSRSRAAASSRCRPPAPGAGAPGRGPVDRGGHVRGPAAAPGRHACQWRSIRRERVREFDEAEQELAESLRTQPAPGRAKPARKRAARRGR